MRRPLALIFAMSFFLGCHTPGSSDAPTDPFFGRTRVTPPSTGIVSGNPSQLGAASATAGPGATNLPPLTSWPAPASATPATPAMAAQPASSSPPAWTPRTNAPPAAPASIPAAIPAQSGANLQPPNGNFAFPANTGGQSATLASSGSGDRLSIPLTARTLNERYQDSMSPPPSQSALPTGGSSLVAPPSVSISGGSSTSQTAPTTLSGRFNSGSASAPAPTAQPSYQSYLSPPSTAQPTVPSPVGSEKPVNLADLPEAR